MGGKLYFILVAFFCLGSWSCDEQVEKSIADSQFAKGEYSEAILSYSEELKNNPKDIELLFSRGRAFQELGQLLEAQADFELALEQEPSNFKVLLSLATVHLDQESYASALLYATKAEEVPGAPAMASLLKGRALHQLGVPEDALKAYSVAIQLDKNFAQAYYNRGILKVALERTKLACEDFQRAASLEYPGAKEALNTYCSR